MPDHLQAVALEWCSVGCSVVPTRPDGTKAPALPWEKYQRTAPTRQQVTAWTGNGQYDGIGLVCGHVSGHLEMLEAEGRAFADGYLPKLAQALHDHDAGHLWDRLNHGYIEVTPSGGLHWLFRVTGGPAKPNTKLARRPGQDPQGHPTVEVLFETRGEGGYVVVAPSGGRTHPTGGSWHTLAGDPTTLPTLTVDERDLLYAVIGLLDEMPQDQQVTARAEPVPRPGDDLRPGDDYNRRAAWDDVLTPHGWAKVRRLGDGWAWRRPGKTIGISATTGTRAKGDPGADRLYVFSTSTSFDAEKPYSKFAALAHLEHGGDMAACASTLRRAGYGTAALNGHGDEAGLAALIAPTRQTAAPDGAGTTVTAPAAPTLAPTLPEVFWDRPVHEHIRQAARARILAPDAVLGAVLARVSLVTDYRLRLPALPRDGSLNVIIALAGDSGNGKGSCLDIAAELVPAPNEPCECGDIDHDSDYIIAQPGSGEGLVKNFFEAVLETSESLDGKKKRETVQRIDRRHVLVRVDEGESLTALALRQGQTTMQILRQAWSGEAIGFSYANREKRLRLPAHDYRMPMILGIQPTLAEPLFSDVAGGTPQRFVWLGLTDPGMPDEVPRWPGPLPYLGVKGSIFERYLQLDPAIRHELAARHRARVSGRIRIDPMDSHRDLSRLKVAALLARLERRLDVSGEDWQLAGLLMDTSDAVREWVRGCIDADQARRQEHAIAARVEAATAIRAGEQAVDKRIAAATQRIIRHVAEHAAETGKPCSWRCLDRLLGSKYLRVEKEAARDAALAGRLIVEVAGDGDAPATYLPPGAS